MKKILGILGGMGPQASIRLYDLIIKKSIQDFCIQKNADMPHILLDNISVPDLVLSRKDEEKTIRIVEKEARRLSKAGATMLALACNTMHLYQDRIQSAAGIPFLSIIDAVVKKVLSSGIKKVGLVGSVTTMRSDLYRKPLEAAGIEVLVPPYTDQDRIGKLIHEIIAGENGRKERDEFADILARLHDTGAEGVILGCTELPFLVDKKTAIPLFDSLEILSESICKKLFEQHSGIKIALLHSKGRIVRMPTDKKPLRDLTKLFASIDDEKEAEMLLLDILTPQERDTIAERWQLIQALGSGMAQREVAKKCGVSISKITRGSHELQYGSGGFRHFLKKLKMTRS